MAAEFRYDKRMGSLIVSGPKIFLALQLFKAINGPVKVNRKMAIMALRWIFFGFELLALETWEIKHQFWVRNPYFQTCNFFFSFQFKYSGLVTEFFTSML